MAVTMETESFRACEFSRHLVTCVKQVQSGYEQVCSIYICLWAMERVHQKDPVC